MLFSANKSHTFNCTLRWEHAQHLDVAFDAQFAIQEPGNDLTMRLKAATSISSTAASAGGMLCHERNNLKHTWELCIPTQVLLHNKPNTPFQKAKETCRESKHHLSTSTLIVMDQPFQPRRKRFATNMPAVVIQQPPRYPSAYSKMARGSTSRKRPHRQV